MFGGMNINDLLYKNIDFRLVFISLIELGTKSVYIIHVQEITLYCLQILFQFSVMIEIVIGC